MKKMQDTHPKVSVVIACYNAEKYIRAALDSLLGQTFSSWEAIVVDDASKDGSRDVVRGYSDPRIRLVCNESNSGPSFSRNRGLQEATGQWVAVLDADDQFKPERLERLVGVAEEIGADAIADNLEVFEDRTGRLMGDWFSIYGVPILKLMCLTPSFFANFEIGVIKALIRRDFLSRTELQYAVDVKYGEDFLLYLQSLQFGARFYVVPEAYYRLRRGETDSLTTNHLVLVERVMEVNRRVLAMHETSSDVSLTQVLHRRLSELEILRRYHSLLYPLRQGNLKFALRAFMRDPGSVICVVRHASKRVFQRYKGSVAR